MTRLFTTLNPEEMTKDPVFSFNPQLPAMANRHSGRLIYYCGLIPNDDPATTPAKLITEDGHELNYPNGTGNVAPDSSENVWLNVDMPASLYTQVLREEGSPENVGDNSAAIIAAINRQNGGRVLGGRILIRPGSAAAARPGCGHVQTPEAPRLMRSLWLILPLMAACGGSDIDPPPLLDGKLIIGSSDYSGEGYVEISDGEAVELVPGGQGGFHLWTTLRVRDVRGPLILRREARLVSDGSLI